jgi:hypothetical protein
MKIAISGAQRPALKAVEITDIARGSNGKFRAFFSNSSLLLGNQLRVNIVDKHFSRQPSSVFTPRHQPR